MPVSQWIMSFWSWLRSRITLPLLLALLLSLCLHLGAFSGVDWSLWGDEEDAVQTIEARLQAAAAPVPSQPAIQPKSVANTPKPQPAPEQPLANESKVEPKAATEATATADNRSAETPSATEQIDAATPEEDAPPLQSEPEVLPTPYQTVNTSFDVYLNGEKRPSGSATIAYQGREGQYSLRWEIQGSGLMRLLYPKLIQESSGQLTEQGLSPEHYRYAFGNKADKTYEAHFQRSDRVITLITSKGEQVLPLPANTQDLLSFMYQFMYVPPTQEMRVTLTNGKRLGEYEYEFEGEETLEIAGKPCNTMHIAHTRGETDEKVELWLATDYRNVPVKIRKTEKNGTVIEQLATRLIAE